MLSFILAPGGKERSGMRRNSPTLPVFGIRPNLLTLAFLTSSGLNGPAILPAEISVARYPCTEAGFLIAASKFDDADTCSEQWYW